MINFVTVAVLTLSLSALCKSQQLKVEYSSARLPQGDPTPRLHYDEDDSIYIFLGTRQVLKYSLALDAIFQVGTLPVTFSYGSIQLDRHGNLFLFGHNEVTKYEITENRTSIVATTPWNIAGQPSVTSCSSVPENEVTILGDYTSSRNKILSFDLRSYNFTESPKKVPFDLHGSAAVCSAGRNFIFPHYSSGNKTVWEFDYISQLFTPLGKPDLPLLMGNPSPVPIDGEIFVVAGFHPSQLSDHEGILRFDPATNNTDFILVENWPVKNGERHFGHPPRCLYVKKLDRIYCFGGLSINLDNSGSRNHDEIFFIDVNSLTTTSTQIETTTEMTSTSMNPDFFNCGNRTNGLYPHPTDCSLFIKCSDNEIEHLFCPFPLLFNPFDKICDVPERVDCDTSCVDRPNGFYQHPHDCAMYFICYDEVATFYKCPPGYLFDPTIRACNFPQSVECLSDSI